MVVGARQSENRQPGRFRRMQARKHFRGQLIAVCQRLGCQRGVVGLHDAITGPVARNPSGRRQQCGVVRGSPSPALPGSLSPLFRMIVLPNRPRRSAARRLTVVGMVGFMPPIPAVAGISGFIYEAPRGIAIAAIGILMTRR